MRPIEFVGWADSREVAAMSEGFCPLDGARLLPVKPDPAVDPLPPMHRGECSRCERLFVCQHQPCPSSNADGAWDWWLVVRVAPGDWGPAPVENVLRVRARAHS